MKRTELKRKTPLVSRTPLQSRTELHRTDSLRPASRKRQRQNAVRVITERDLGRVNGEGLCARCGSYGPVNGHELVRRSQGGDPARPDCLLCPPCNTWAASGNLRIAAWTGWLITPKYPHDPALENSQARDLNGDIVHFAPREGAV